MNQSHMFSVLNLEEYIITALRKAQIQDLRQIFHFSCTELQQITNLKQSDVTKLKDEAAKKYMLHGSHTALQILQKDVPKHLQSWKLSTTCSIIDSVLRGGMLSGVLTELTGESGSGKTQLCLQLCISIQFNQEASGGAVYICTEDAFPSKRLHQMMTFFKQHLPDQNLGDNIFIEHIANFDALDHCVKKKLPTLLNRGLVKLIVLDSVTALFRCQYDSSQSVSRAKHLIEFGSILQSLAYKHNIVIICVNQVSANISQVGSHEGSVIPALGLTWSNQIACRIFLSRLNCTEEEDHHTSGCNKNIKRSLKVVFAHHLSQSEVPISIHDCGVQGIISN